ncbi:Methyltransf-11 domain-containing protein [Pyrenophora tritici-repentis]|nr:Methyltransf-11 domain-containing protein [Pyrenophora tritici-repentis]KAI0615397.1 Methyltransf-11 domain-containing protein [Pyrenophora tritici-repentis]KAI0627454.1 Methyltransf-11 domain-containing protein [Pyrenophora tritici-repentis]
MNTMFPTFDVPPQHSETVGARKARRAKQEETARRSSTATSRSSGSANSTASKRQDGASSSDSRTEGKSGFGGWFGKNSKKGIQEISPLANDKPTSHPKDLMIELDTPPDEGPAPRTAPLDTDEHVFRRPQSHHSEREPYAIPPQRLAPPLTPLPTPPATRYSPFPMSDRASQYSTQSRSSSNPASVAQSNNSVFSGSSGYETALSEDSHHDPRYSVTSPKHHRLNEAPVFEPVERGSRTGSRHSSERDQSTKAAQSPFARALSKMQSASTRIISTRLSEEWDGLEDDDSYQEIVFEKRLWALTAYQRLTQNKPLQSPAHELLSDSRPEDQRRILHIHGSLADGWVLASRYPMATVYTLSSIKSHPVTQYSAPLNHHLLYAPSLSSPTPFPDGYFDAIISRSVATSLRHDEWAQSFFDSMRILKPGGHIEILAVDAHMSREGPKLSAWVDEHLSCRLEAQGVSKQPSDTVLDTMEIVGLENIRRARIALPAQPPKAMAKVAPAQSHTFGTTIPAPTPQDTLDTSRMMAFLGRLMYQGSYNNYMHAEQGDEWFWSRKDIREECDHYKTKLVLTIACAQKPYDGHGMETYLDI